MLAALGLGARLDQGLDREVEYKVPHAKSWLMVGNCESLWSCAYIHNLVLRVRPADEVGRLPGAPAQTRAHPNAGAYLGAAATGRAEDAMQ